MNMSGCEKYKYKMHFYVPKNTFCDIFNGSQISLKEIKNIL